MQQRLERRLCFTEQLLFVVSQWAAETRDGLVQLRGARVAFHDGREIGARLVCHRQHAVEQVDYRLANFSGAAHGGLTRFFGVAFFFEFALAFFFGAALGFFDGVAHSQHGGFEREQIADVFERGNGRQRQFAG